MRIQDQAVHLSLKYKALLAKDYYPPLHVQSLKQSATLLPAVLSQVLGIRVCKLENFTVLAATNL